jgi:ribosomal protein S18 acetylase RimI-like enzyme
VSGCAAGLAWARVEPEDRTVAKLYQMWVSPSYRGLGAGRMLLSAAIEWAKNRGAKALHLCVTCGDTPAARLYARAGFTPVGLPEPLRPGSEVLAQTLRLALVENAG